jgi:uncharacterized protein (TIGR02646 family)
MIKIRKPAEPPAVLLERGRPARDRWLAAYDREPEAYRRGRQKFAVNSAIYGHRQVREALIAAQYGKCCFCEARIIATAYGDVEHYRPKAGWRQTADDDLQPPGYYWLAYEWPNLLLACTRCNQEFKQNLFPLRDPARRATSHHDDLSREQPLLLHPAETEPERFLSFRHEVAFAPRANRAGSITIAVVGLNRPALREARREHLSKLHTLYQLRRLAHQRPSDTALQSLAQAAQQQLDQAIEDSAPFAAASRAALACDFRYAL